jgi:hypothetical protein
MQHIIELVEREYNLTHIGTDENGVHLFKCNDCGKIHRVQIVAGMKPPERQPVPDAFYKAFEQDDLEQKDNNE